MKICPQCRSTYTDDSLRFCLQDGAALEEFSGSSSSLPTISFNESETFVQNKPQQVRIDLPETRQTAPQVAPNTELGAYNTEPKTSKTWLLAILGLFSFLIIGGIGAAAVWIYLSTMNSNVVDTTNRDVVKTNTNPFGNRNTKVSENSENSSNSETNFNIGKTNTNINTPTPTPKPTIDPAGAEVAKKEVESTLYGWKSSAEDHNLAANMSNYADSVSYYTSGKLNKSKLKASKEPAYQRYNSIQIDIDNLKVSLDSFGEKATVVFDKYWDFNGIDKNGFDIYYRGKVQQQLILNKIGGKWKIVSEKDLKVYESNRSSAR